MNPTAILQTWLNVSIEYIAFSSRNLLKESIRIKLKIQLEQWLQDIQESSTAASMWNIFWKEDVLMGKCYQSMTIHKTVHY